MRPTAKAASDARTPRSTRSDGGADRRRPDAPVLGPSGNESAVSSAASSSAAAGRAAAAPAAPMAAGPAAWGAEGGSQSHETGHARAPDAPPKTGGERGPTRK